MSLAFPEDLRPWRAKFLLEQEIHYSGLLGNNCSFSVVLELCMHTELDFTSGSWRTQILHSPLE